MLRLQPAVAVVPNERELAVSLEGKARWTARILAVVIWVADLHTCR